MKKYKVTVFDIIEGEPKFYSIDVTCNDVATEIWLNSQYKHILEVEEIK